MVRTMDEDVEIQVSRQSGNGTVPDDRPRSQEWIITLHPEVLGKLSERLKNSSQDVWNNPGSEKDHPRVCVGNNCDCRCPKNHDRNVFVSNLLSDFWIREW